MTEDQLRALLRLKRYEQPPAGYFDRLLQDVHRRQRTELLKRPIWRIALDRLQTFFGEHSMGHASYAGAMAGLLVVGLAAIGLLTPNSQQTPQGTNVAAVTTDSAAKPAERQGSMIALETQQATAPLDLPSMTPTAPPRRSFGSPGRGAMMHPVSFQKIPDL